MEIRKYKVSREYEFSDKLRNSVKRQSEIKELTSNDKMDIYKVDDEGGVVLVYKKDSNERIEIVCNEPDRVKSKLEKLTGEKF